MHDQLNKQEIAMLREELELLMLERAGLLKVVGAAAALVANTDGRHMPPEAAEAAELLSMLVNNLPEETLLEALESVNAKVDPSDLEIP